MQRDVPLVAGETYHVFNRGAHKRTIFTNNSDYQRFMLLLLLANHSESINLRDLFIHYKGRSFVDIFQEEKPDKSLVEMLAYNLMPNHFHLVVRQKGDAGVTIFMKKIATAYSMYFNTKYGHSGTLFQGRFKSRHVGTEPYFRYIFSYVHLNSLDLFEPGWEEKGLRDLNGARRYINSYPYSSFFDYSGNDRAEKTLLSLSQAPEFLTTENDLEVLLSTFTKVGPLYGVGISSAGQ